MANWIPIAALAVTTVGVLVASANYLGARRERQRNTEKGVPRIQATVNPDFYEGDWRSVQLHVVPLDEDQRDFRYESWRIERVNLLRPRGAVLARAADDDYATGQFDPEHPVRELEGRSTGRPQQFALEFFMKFPEAQDGQKAVFKVTYSNAKIGKRFKTTVHTNPTSAPRLD